MMNSEPGNEGKAADAIKAENEGKAADAIKAENEGKAADAIKAEKKRRASAYMQAVILIVIGLIGITGLVLIHKGIITEQPKEEPVPNIVNMHVDKAVIMLYSTKPDKGEMVRFVSYTEGKNPKDCEPMSVDTERLEDYVVLATYPEAGEMYIPGKDVLYLAVEDSVKSV